MYIWKQLTGYKLLLKIKNKEIFQNLLWMNSKNFGFCTFFIGVNISDMCMNLIWMMQDKFSRSKHLYTWPICEYYMMSIDLCMTSVIFCSNLIKEEDCSDQFFWQLDWYTCIDKITAVLIAVFSRPHYIIQCTYRSVH